MRGSESISKWLTRGARELRKQKLIVGVQQECGGEPAALPVVRPERMVLIRLDE
jgi:hypothetical protein